MTDWTQDDLRDAILADLVAQMPKPARPGDFTKPQFAAAAGISIPAADYRLKGLVGKGVLESEMCTVGGRTTRVWRQAGV